MGKFKLGVVLVTWPDGEPDGRTTDWYHDYFCNPAREGIARYWYQQSQGKLVFEGDVLDWVPLKATLKDLQKKDKDGIYEGFIHGTGHGLGLEIHECPRVSRDGKALKEGNVVSVEPGLYYRDIGGCRIEDIVYVRKEGVEMLSQHDYSWKID